MTGRMERRLAQLEAVQTGRLGLHVFRVLRDLEVEALARWKAAAGAGIPEAATVVWVELHEAEMTR